MKKITPALFLIFSAACCFSQSNRLPISASYFSPFGNRIGVKAGTEFQLTELRSKPIYLQPQIGYFWKYRINRSYLVNADFQLKLQKENRSFFHAPTIGLGYLINSKVIDSKITLGSGAIKQNRAVHNLFLPTAGYQAGWLVSENLETFLKIFYGREIAFQSTDAGFFGFEIGFNFK